MIWDKLDYLVLFGTLKTLTIFFHTYNDAVASAQALRKRLPTAEEWNKLHDCPSVWEWEITTEYKISKGRWFAEREEDLKNPEKSLFLPELGIALKTTRNKWEILYPHECTYWSSSASIWNNDLILCFTTNYMRTEKLGYSPFGYGEPGCSNFVLSRSATMAFPVRCVSGF